MTDRAAPVASQTAELRKISTLLKEGRSHAEIAKALGRTLTSTKGLIYRNKLHKGPGVRNAPPGRSPFKTKVQRKRVLEFFRQELLAGRSGPQILKEIEQKFNLTLGRNIHHQWVKQMGPKYVTLMKANAENAKAQHLRQWNKRKGEKK